MEYIHCRNHHKYTFSPKKNFPTQCAVKDLAEQHKEACKATACGSCKFKIDNVDSWDQKHRVGRLLQLFEGKTLRDIIKEKGWQTTSSPVTQDASNVPGNLSVKKNKPGRSITCVPRRFFLNGNRHTDGRTYERTDIRTDGRTLPLIEMRGRI